MTNYLCMLHNGEKIKPVAWSYLFNILMEMIL